MGMQVHKKDGQHRERKAMQGIQTNKNVVTKHLWK